MAIRLTELEPDFIRYETRIETYDVIDGDHKTWVERGRPTKPFTGPKEYIHHGFSFEEAQGISFLCPRCFVKNNGKAGTHTCHVTFKGRYVGASQGIGDGKGGFPRWKAQGSGFEDLTLTPSVQIVGGCGWHGYITDGEVRG